MSAASRDNRAALRRDVEAQINSLSLSIAEEILAIRQGAQLTAHVR